MKVEKIRIIYRRSIPYLFILPAFIILMGLVFYPVLYSFYLSFHSWGGGVTAPSFVGITNFEDILGSAEWWNAVKLSGVWTGGTVVMEFLIGFGIALLFSMKMRARKIFRVLFVVPMVMTPIVSSLTWKTLIYHPNVGIANYFLSLVNLRSQVWLGKISVTMISLIIYDAWHWIPFVTLCLLAGLSSLPQEPYDAAKVDGASTGAMFRYITLPLMKPVIWIALLFRSIDAFRTFDVIYAMTGGGPGRTTQTLPLYIFQTGLEYLHFGEGASLAIMTAGLATILVLPQVRIFARRK